MSKALHRQRADTVVEPADVQDPAVGLRIDRGTRSTISHQPSAISHQRSTSDHPRPVTMATTHLLYYDWGSTTSAPAHPHPFHPLTCASIVDHITCSPKSIGCGAVLLTNLPTDWS